MIAQCACSSLPKWAKDPDFPIVERDGGYVLGNGSIDDPQLTIHFCPFCGEHGWPGRGDRPCECGVMESLVQDCPQLIEFDSVMNEFHVLLYNPKGKLQVYYCIACGGKPPESLRHTFFEAPSSSDYDEAWARMADLKDENDFIREFGAPPHVFDISPLRAKDIEIYGMKPRKKQWTFEPAGSPISYVLQLMADGTYEKLLGAKHKKSNNA
jgi:hypothetical protein